MNGAAWQRLVNGRLVDESDYVETLIASLGPEADFNTASEQASRWIADVRKQPPSGIEALLLEYPLSTSEGVALTCIAEALLRIPEPAVADRLIRDVLDPLIWESHLGQSGSLFVNAATWGLALTGRWLSATEHPEGDAQTWLRRLTKTLGEPLLRQALMRAMRYLAEQFVIGEDLPIALRHATPQSAQTYSFDMLGEAALTERDSERYFLAYRSAIEQVAMHAETAPDTLRASVSIKLSALHPRYTSSQKQRLDAELFPRLLDLAKLAARLRIDVCIDAEEADRLEISLQLFAKTMAALENHERCHFGLVVQAYAKSALRVLQWLAELSDRYSARINVRLVKGAYWDTEIKRAQQRGLASYPVFTSKSATDISYLACAKFILQHPQRFFPQFATHNAATIASVIALQPDVSRFELQRLYGMGEALYRILERQYPELHVRVYAPVGSHHELLPYLIRRLLENGANTSFIHQLHDSRTPIALLAAHPTQQWRAARSSLPLPNDLWKPLRENSPGIYWHNEMERDNFLKILNTFAVRMYNYASAEESTAAVNPYSSSPIGCWRAASFANCDNAINAAKAHQPRWQQTSIQDRAKLLERCAELFVHHRAELVALITRETGRTLENSYEEVREAIDFCRYYASEARSKMCVHELPSITGEENRLLLIPRGIFVAISPWNFPLAIFCGQIVAALVTGNAVLAKPAEQATLTALRAIELMHEAGIPQEILHCLPGPGETIGQYLCALRDINGIVFTGGFETAYAIRKIISAREGEMIPFIAETSGINVLIADSSAQPQQLVSDVIRSAFDSAGQRCSALRILCIPEICADEIEPLIIGAMQQLRLGDPIEWQTDVGPVIDPDAKASLVRYLTEHSSQLLFQLDARATGNFVPPTLLRVMRIDEVNREAFGPVLHILRYRESETHGLVDQINALGFGLTCGLHSRNHVKAVNLAMRLRVGNIYINRDIIGANVGAQPFGGMGKSGTGPKAGGPHYLFQFTSEKTITTNTAALGGDHKLLSL